MNVGCRLDLVLDLQLGLGLDLLLDWAPCRDLFSFHYWQFGDRRWHFQYPNPVGYGRSS